jgi:tellurite methyltransferase
MKQLIESKWGPPNEEMLAFINHLKRRLPKGGTVLDVGGGDGRNALPLARAGFKVHVIDVNGEDIKALKDRARLEGLTHLVEGTIGDIRRCALKGKYDAVICAYVLQMVSPKEWSSVLEKIKAATKRGGYHKILFFLEHPKVIRPSPSSTSFKKGELKKFYSDWRIVHYKENPLRLDPGHPFDKNPRYRVPHYHKTGSLEAIKK